MRSLHIVLPYNSNAMKHMSEPLLTSEALKKIYTITTGTLPDPLADLNYHIPWHTLVGLDMPDTKHAMLYTHCNRGDELKLVDACSRADRIICMSFKGRQELLDLGVSPEKLWVIYAPAGNLQLRRKNVGIVGFRQPNGRKREHVLLDLMWQMDPQITAMLNFVVVGGGMKELCEELKSLGGSVEYYENLTEIQMSQLYSQLDLLLVTGYVEGGPLPVLEAMSTGVRMLAPHVGFADDFLTEDSLYSSMDELMEKLTQFVKPAIDNFYMSRLLSSSLYVREHALLFGDLTGQSAEVEMGVDRYRQLLRIIQEHKVHRILEVGTWNGERAVQMIQQALRFSPTEKVEYIGYDLFEKQTAQQLREEFSKEACPEDLVARRLAPTGVRYTLIPGNTKESMRWRVPQCDLYFIDGGHSEETIQSDWNNILPSLTNASVVVFDDYYLPYQEGFGCNKLVDTLDPTLFDVEILGAATHADDRDIYMVKVRPINADLHILMSTASYPGRDHAFDAMRYGLSLSGMPKDHAPSAPASKSKLGWIASAFGALTRSWRKTVA